MSEKTLEHRIIDLEHKYADMEKQVGRILSHLESESGSLSRSLRPINKMLEDHDRTLYGHPLDPDDDGLKGRYADMKKEYERAVWYWRLILGGILIKVFYDLWLIKILHP